MFQLVLDEFQGPLDLLLILIQKKKLDITEISINKIADDFLAEVDKLKENSLEVISDFIFVATKILEIKSRYMLNITNVEDEEYSLVDSLEEYAKYKAMAERFTKIYDTNILPYEKLPDEIIFNEELNLEGYTLDSITKYIRQEEKQEEIFPIVIKQNKKTIEEKIDYIDLYLKKHSQCIFDDILQEKDKPEKVVSLLSVLQMARNDIINLKQNYNFSTIILNKELK